MSEKRLRLPENGTQENENLHVGVLRAHMQKGKSLDEAYQALRSEAATTDPAYDKFRDRTLEELDRAYRYLKKWAAKEIKP